MPIAVSLSFEDLDRVPFAELHDRLLPVWALAGTAADFARFPTHVGRPDACDLDPEQRFHSLANSGLRGLWYNLEGVLAALLITRGALLRHNRAHDRAMKC